MSKPNADKIREAIIIIFIFIAIISIIFYPAVFQGHVIYQENEPGSDLFDINISRRYLAVQAITNFKEFPLWEPKIGCGVPLFAESEAGVLHPSILFFMSNDLTAAANLTILSAILIAMLGTYVFCRCLDLQPSACIIAALSYGLGETFLLRTSGLNIIHVIAWLPSILALLHLWITTEKKRYCFLLAIIWTLQLLASHFQMFAICLICSCLYGMSVLCIQRSLHVKNKIRIISAVFLTLVFALLLGMVQILPTKELTEQSIRNEVQSIEQLNRVSPNWRMLSIFVNPYYHCWPIGPKDIAARNRMCLFASDCFQYIGILPLLLCLGSVIFIRKRQITVIWCLTIFFLITSMGPNYGIYFLLYKFLPFINKFRLPGRFAIPMMCLMTVLAAFGAQALGAWLSEKYGKKVSQIILLTIILLTCLDLGSVNAQTQGYLPHEWSASPPTLQKIAHPQRIYSPYSRLAWIHSLNKITLSNANRQNSLWQHRSLLSPGIAHIWQIETPDDYVSYGLGISSKYSYAIQSSLYYALDAIIQSNDKYISIMAPKLDDWLRLLGVSHIIMPWPFPDNWPNSELSLVSSISIPEIPDEKIYIYQLASPLKKTRLVPKLQPNIPNDCINLEQIAGLKSTESLYEPNLSAPEDIGQATIQRITNNTISIHTKCDQNAHLIISNSFDPNWNATVDGHPVKIQLTNLAIQSLPVPQGEHRIEMRYISPAFETGWRISVVALIAFISLGLWAAHRSAKLLPHIIPNVNREAS